MAKINLKKLLINCIKQTEDNYILLYDGFINNCSMSEDDRKYLMNLAVELRDSDLVITFDDTAITPYITSYNGCQVLAGIKFNKLEKW